MMKKVTMLVMAMALVVPALGLVSDNPPGWAAGENTATAVWDFSDHDEMEQGGEAYLEASCLDGTSCSAFFPIDGSFNGETKVLAAGMWYSIGIPDVEGDFVTLRVQVFTDEGEAFEADGFEVQAQSYCPTFADDGNCGWEFAEVDVNTEVENVIIYTTTFARYEAGECGEAGFAALGGWIGFPAEERGYTAVIADVIVHGEGVPEDGPRVSSCFRTPTIVAGSAEVAEEGTTSAALTIQLDRDAAAPVTVTVYEPVGEDPNISDPEAFTITGATGSPGVATLIIPADSNSATITVTAIDDTAIEGDLGYGLVIETAMDPNVAGYDPNLDTSDNALLVGGSVTVIDNDVRNVLVDPDFVGLSELDPNAVVCVNVTLSHEPNLPEGEVGVPFVNVAVEMAEWAWDVGMVETDANLVDPNYLQFDKDNWYIPQTICFSAIDNGELAEVGLSHVPALCFVNPTTSNDPGFNPDTGLEPGAVIGIEVEEKACGGRGFDFRDINEDCYVTVEDLAVFVESWLNCTDVTVEGCIE